MPLPLIGISIRATPRIIVFACHARFYAIALKPVLAATLLVLALMLAMQMMAHRLPSNALPWQGLAGPGKTQDR